MQGFRSRRVASGLVLAVLLVAARASAGGSNHGSGGGGSKVTLCHVALAQTLSADQSMVARHLPHGDYRGACSTIAVKKVVSPGTDAGRFNLTVDTTVYATNVGNGGSTGARAVTPGVQHSASETGGTSTSLADYVSSYVCKDGSSTIASGNGVVTAPLRAAVAGHSVVCTFTNVRKKVSVCSVSKYSPYAQTLAVYPNEVASYVAKGGFAGACSTLTVKKVLSPSNNSGKFNLKVDTTVYATNVGNGGSTGAHAVAPGVQHSASETAGSSTTLTRYVSSYVCKDGATTIASGTGTTTGSLPAAIAGHDVVSTFTNTVAPPSHLIIDKVTNPALDSTQFTFDPGSGFSASEPNFNLADATTPKDFAVYAGTYSVTEGALPTGWTLSSLVCSDGSTQSGATATVTLAAGQTVTCTFTNSKPEPTVQFTKTVVPDDHSLWNLRVLFSNGNYLELLDTQPPFTSDVITALEGSVTLSESAGTGSSLDGYTFTAACTNNGVAVTPDQGPTFEAGSYFIKFNNLIRGDKLVCNFTNTLKVQV